MQVTHIKFTTISKILKTSQMLIIPSLPMRYISNQEILQVSLYKVLIFLTGISTVFLDQMPIFRVFRRVPSMPVSQFSTVYHLASQVLGMKRHNLSGVASIVSQLF
jgi:hypothetical protein